MISAARDRYVGGTAFDPERLTRYERGLGIPLRADETSIPTRQTGRETQTSPVTQSSFSRGCRVIANLAALLIIISLFLIPLAELIWITVCLFCS